MVDEYRRQDDEFLTAQRAWDSKLIMVGLGIVVFGLIITLWDSFATGYTTCGALFIFFGLMMSFGAFNNLLDTYKWWTG